MKTIKKILGFIWWLVKLPFWPITYPIRLWKQQMHKKECLSLGICPRCGEDLDYYNDCRSCKARKQIERNDSKTELKTELAKLVPVQDARRAELKTQLQKQLDENQQRILNELITP